MQRGMSANAPILGAIAVVAQDDHVILVQRGKEPRKGCWGFPGGHVELGETALDAAVRELQEETGVVATPRSYLTNIDVILRDEQDQVTRHYMLAAVLCDYVSGTPIAADDAADARWVSAEDLHAPELQLLDQVAELAVLACDLRRAST
ncbi:MAG: NUDIX domain-containing protein [Rhodobacteraceae bacterium]|nr:NUDIX domain-containing protein [Paracoccaceae bacterium]